MLELTITNEQKIRVAVNPVTATGRPARLDGDPEFKVISGNAKVEAVPDNPAAVYLVSPDEPGDTVVLVSADADLGEGVETISDTIKVHVEGALATNLGLVAGLAEPK